MKYFKTLEARLLAKIEADANTILLTGAPTGPIVTPQNPFQYKSAEEIAEHIRKCDLDIRKQLQERAFADLELAILAAGVPASEVQLFRYNPEPLISYYPQPSIERITVVCGGKAIAHVDIP